METLEVHNDNQKTREKEALQEENSKTVGDDKSVISTDKTLIALEG